MIHQLLHQYWGFEKFRPLQEEVIQSVLDGKDTLALLPTGGGKSICFQIPALASEGLAIVVTPLISLMKDQVQNLNKRGIRAIAVYSGMTSHEIDIALDNAIYGDYKFLYLREPCFFHTRACISLRLFFLLYECHLQFLYLYL